MLMILLALVVFAGVLSLKQLGFAPKEKHNIRRDVAQVKIVEVAKPAEAAEPAKPAEPAEPAEPVPIVPVQTVVKASKVLKVIEPVNPVQEIPRIIHQFWVGDKKQPEKLMDHCRDLHPNWEYKLWTEKNLFPLQNQKTYDCGSNNFKSDVARYELLQRYGGFYLDADTLCRRSLEPLRKKQFVAGYHHYRNPGLKGNKRYDDTLVASAVIGAPKGSVIVDQLVAGLKNDPGLCKKPAWSAVGPLYLTNTLKKLNFKNIMPFHAFVPYHYIEAKKGMGNYEKMEKYDSYAANLWGTTFNNWAKMDVVHKAPAPTNTVP